MGRKTYSLSAIALAASAAFSFSSLDGAEAFARDTGETDPAPVATPAPAEQDITFTSLEVVQPIAHETPESAETPSAASSLRELVSDVATDAAMSEQMRCLAGAVYFESRGEPLDGQLAVAEVIINRAEDRRWPASYCGVVYQRSQFSFVRGGRMPRIKTASAAWTRAKAIAKIAHEELWESDAADAVYFHANYVKPRWSRAKTRLAQIDTHIFYR
ncbi:cell wall hydrolase [Erythrobacter sp.]|jgi:spore germination cell wall hydrolase CwlJ-like protein|uniref:cell wall hydrolase n=1 Tax=Erythrobacter sp. TaxID=1042 RepID=UPI002E9B3224|nr:cell wall hydrolase [Erythrobacter sp.]